MFQFLVWFLKVYCVVLVKDNVDEFKVLMDNVLINSELFD